MSVFDAIRDHVTLSRIFPVNGSSKAHCVAPDHQDNHPSMHIYEDHVHCFSCGFHGDVTDVWAALRGCERPIEAALDLAREFGIELPAVSADEHRSWALRRASGSTLGGSMPNSRARSSAASMGRSNPRIAAHTSLTSPWKPHEKQ